ncbi:MAG: peptidylprolyl isomerase [Planctomycetota bacterium]|nr:peptidylprolyl isomerase [Planctomycetota bacterium]
MNLKLKLVVIAALAVISLGLWHVYSSKTPLEAAKSQSAQVPIADKVVVRGKDFEIKRSQIDEVLTSYKANSGTKDEPLPEGAEVQVLNQLIDQGLVLQKATEADKAEGKSDGDQAFAKIVKSFDSPEKFAQQLKDAKMTESRLHAEVVDEGIARAALTHALHINVTDAEVKEFFESRGPGAYDLPERAHVRQIFLSKTKDFSEEPLPPETILTKRKLMDDLLKRIRAGEDFGALARQYSEDLNSNENDGAVRPFARHETAIADTAFSLKPNAVSDVITLRDGFHIIKLMEITPAQTKKVSDLADQIRTFLIGQKTRELAPAYLAKLRKDAGVVIVDPALNAAALAAQAEASTEPATTESATTEPVTTESATTEPATTEPAATLPSTAP